MTGLLAELRRRSVFRVGAAYLVTAWLIMQFVALIEEPLSLPGWTDTLIIVLLASGLPIVLIAAWAFEMTPEGVKRSGPASATGHVSRPLGGTDYALIGLMTVILGLSLFQALRPAGPAPGPESAQLAAGAQTETPTIAVLPFRNLGDASSASLTDGLHDDLLTQLSRIASLRVISRTSVMGYRDTQENIRDIGQALSATHILEGGIQQAGERVRINIQLIDAASDEHLWAETYDRALTIENIFEIQSAIAREITNALRAELTDAEAAAIAQTPTDVLEAYEAYLSGRAEMLNAGVFGGELTQAIADLRRAVSLDPGFAEAWVALLNAYSFERWLDRDFDPLPPAEPILRHIGTLVGQDHYLMHHARGVYTYYALGQPAEAEPHLEAALALQPNDLDTMRYLAFVNRRTGDLDEAIDYAMRILERDPRDLNTLANSIFLTRLAGRYEDLADLLEQANPDDLQLDELQWVIAREFARATGDREPMLRLYMDRAVGGTEWLALILTGGSPHRQLQFEVDDRVLAAVETEALDSDPQFRMLAEWAVPAMRAVNAFAIGDMDRVEDSFQRAMALGLEAEPPIEPNGPGFAWSWAGMFDLMRGDGEYAARVEAALDQVENPDDAAPVRASFASLRGDRAAFLDAIRSYQLVSNEDSLSYLRFWPNVPEWRDQLPEIERILSSTLENREQAEAVLLPYLQPQYRPAAVAD